MELIMHTRVERAIYKYAAAYQKVHQCMPSSFEALDSRWVMIDGVSMCLSDLEDQTARLEYRYDELMAEKRDVVERLIEWCKQ